MAPRLDTAKSVQSKVTCLPCRRRKVKCDRELPQCRLCQTTGQNCEYPTKILKPGPKIGTRYAGRKRKSSDNVPDNVNQPPLSGKRRRARTDHQRSSTVTSTLPESPNKSDIQSLSFILHPSHEPHSPKLQNEALRGSLHASPQDNHLGAACYEMGVDGSCLDRLIELFFENFTSFQLFRQQHFRQKLESIQSKTQTGALLAAILAFATRGHDLSSDAVSPVSIMSQHSSDDASSYYGNLATRFVNIAIDECDDEPLPLELLQALILTTHWLLIQGVRGKAWRSLGHCIRSAYELHLHLVDAGKPSHDALPNVAQWCADEERRRAWWAIWEMDVFASVIRRCPTGIDWSQNETCLPAEDERWRNGKPQQSSKLEYNPINRWKCLQACGNQSPKAWFIVINSLMKDAQTVSSPVGLERPLSQANEQNTENIQRPQNSYRKSEVDISKEAVDRLRTIQTCLDCTTMVLPEGLQFDGQYLDFGISQIDGHRSAPQRLHHSSVYSIHIMTQLTKLMINKYSIFRSSSQLSNQSTRPSSTSDRDERVSIHDNPLSVVFASHVSMHAFEQYSEAANEIAAIIRRSHEEHYKYVNPLLANTIWLAGAVQLLHQELNTSAFSNKAAISSNFELLSSTYNRFVSYWNMTHTLQKNLETVEEELEKLRQAPTQAQNVPSVSARNGGLKSGVQQTDLRHESWGKVAEEMNSTDKTSNLTSAMIEHRPQRENLMNSGRMQGAAPSTSSLIDFEGASVQPWETNMNTFQRYFVPQLQPSHCQPNYTNARTGIHNNDAIQSFAPSFIESQDASESVLSANAAFMEGVTLPQDFSTSYAHLTNYVNGILSGNLY